MKSRIISHELGWSLQMLYKSAAAAADLFTVTESYDYDYDYDFDCPNTSPVSRQTLQVDCGVTHT